MLPHQLPACTHVAHKDNPNTRQTLVSDNVNVAHGERDKPQSQMKIEGETSKMSRGMKKEDGKLQTRQATRQGTSGQGTSSQATSPHRCRPRKRCVKKAKDKLQNTTAYQQQRINNSVSTGILTKNAFSLREHLAQNTRSAGHGIRGVVRRGEF